MAEPEGLFEKSYYDLEEKLKLVGASEDTILVLVDIGYVGQFLWGALLLILFVLFLDWALKFNQYIKSKDLPKLNLVQASS